MWASSIKSARYANLVKNQLAYLTSSIQVCGQTRFSRIYIWLLLITILLSTFNIDDFLKHVGYILMFGKLNYLLMILGAEAATGIYRKLQVLNEQIHLWTDGSCVKPKPNASILCLDNYEQWQ